MDKKTVLVIEDTPLNMKLVRSLLRLGGYHILEAFDAESGIQLAHKQSPDLILMDILLPGMDGLSAIRLLKNTPQLQHIPIIALTSYAMVGDEKRAQEAGCDGYIAKPLDTRNFLDMIGAYFSDSV